jgi:glycosyltransferase involved in cell wall biosynthesis
MLIVVEETRKEALTLSETPQDVELEILLPVHNEADSIEATLDEIYRVISPIVPMRFILSEDGSTDGTPQLLQSLTDRYPIKLITGPQRKGYSRAVIDALKMVDAPYVLCLDSDGQCDPADFPAFWSHREDADVLIGWRVHRQDTWLRKTLSGSFKLYYRLLFRIFIHDPSCPFVLAPKHVAKTLVPQLGVLSQGFWWEFVARVRSNGYTLKELPVTHRLRAAGQTQVYRLRKLPRIGWTHIMGLLQIRQEYKRAPVQPINAGVERL